MLNKLLPPVLRSLSLLCFLCLCLLLALTLIDMPGGFRYVLWCAILTPFPLIFSALTKWLDRLIVPDAAETDLLRVLRLLAKYALPAVYVAADLAAALLLLMTRKQIYAMTFIYLAAVTMLALLLNLLFKLLFPVAGIDYR